MLYAAIYRQLSERLKRKRPKTPDDEAEILTKTLVDIVAPDLDIIFVGINPGYVAARTGHWYAGAGNHFCE